MPNIEPATATDLERVACAVLCCERKKYDFTTSNRYKKNKDKECEWLGSKKHACVNHALRKKEKGKLAKPKQPRWSNSNIVCTPVCSPQVLRVIKGISKLVNPIPDILIKPNHIVDAKFPCAEEKTLTGAGQSKAGRIGNDMKGVKELTDYTQITSADGQPVNNPKVTTMTPEKAQDTLNGKGCPCEQIKQ
jgi:hypothetical protein